MTHAEELTALARSCRSFTQYRLKSDPALAPLFVDCSSFTQWLFLQIGIEIPRLAFQQMHACILQKPIRQALPGDLVFRGLGRPRAYYIHCPALGIDHVGYVTTDQSVIHAVNPMAGVIEQSLANFADYKDSGLCSGTVCSL